MPPGSARAIGVSQDQDDLDLIAENAGVGAIQVLWPRNEAMVVVERSEGDAEDTEQSYEAFGGTDLERRGQVVVAWTNSPTDEEREDVDACLGG
jgi:hypothetical protein